ncbi:MAG: TetR/AcrR family transcriptional regulator [Candidatus Saccharibacteria bacterium]
MCPRTSTQYEVIRQEKRNLILDTALELFAQNGYHGTSISHISKKAGISKGLVYNYFESKEEILKSIVQSGYEAAYKNLDLNKDGILVQEEFIHFVRMTFRLVKENRNFWALYSSLMFQPGILDLVTPQFEGKSVEIQKLMTDFLKEMGSINPEGDMLAISSLIKGATVILLTAPDFFPIDKLEESVINSCFRIITTADVKSKEKKNKIMEP